MTGIEPSSSERAFSVLHWWAISTPLKKKLSLLTISFPHVTKFYLNLKKWLIAIIIKTAKLIYSKTLEPVTNKERSQHLFSKIDNPLYFTTSLFWNLQNGKSSFTEVATLGLRTGPLPLITRWTQKKEIIQFSSEVSWWLDYNYNLVSTCANYIFTWNISYLQNKAIVSI